MEGMGEGEGVRTCIMKKDSVCIYSLLAYEREKQGWGLVLVSGEANFILEIIWNSLRSVGAGFSLKIW